MWEWSHHYFTVSTNSLDFMYTLLASLRVGIKASLLQGCIIRYDVRVDAGFRFQVTKSQTTPFSHYERWYGRWVNIRNYHRNQDDMNPMITFVIQCHVLAYRRKLLMSTNMATMAITIAVMTTTMMMIMDMVFWKIMIMLPNELCFTYLYLYVHRGVE